jgi:hypothetical protein
MITPSLRASFTFGISVLLFSSSGFSSPQAYDQLANWDTLPERNVGRTPPNWIKNIKFSDGEAVLKSEDGARRLFLKAPEAVERPFHLYFRDLFPVPESGHITVTMVASGQGNIGAFFYLYDDSEVSLGISPKSGEGMQTVGGETDVTLKFSVQISAKGYRKGIPASMRLALVVAPGSEIIVKSIQAKVD